MVRRAVVVGAGPAGIVGALYLAQMDYDVVVYERRPEPSVAERKSQHSYPMLLASRWAGSSGRKADTVACTFCHFRVVRHTAVWAWCQ